MADIGTSIIGNQATVDPSLSPTLPASEESALLRQKILLEIDVLQRQKKVLEMQEEYYSIKQRRLPEDKP
ncbi:hypothetical protein SKAU_G00305120 [Synaphobranchus kaupii]|uniref:Uncharacterized protein n=1 Tax=Synaphobranchus kaupii TaxID=118154 RepID=A0A9Q1IKH1_SYNKA|nr:hypothetical protein SKAU_G00305120 [Synaphobranchus kaupii]